jgi:hypothetical protein
MSVHVYWEDESKAIVRYDFEGEWDWNELYSAYYEAIAMEKSVEHRVDVILDMRHSGRIPSNVLLHVKNFSDRQPPNIGLSVVVTPNTFVHSLYKVGVKFYSKIGFYFRVAVTLEAAHAMIAADRAPNAVTPS